MSAEGFPPIAELVPQSGAMCLLDRVLGHEPAATVCEVTPARNPLLANADGSVPVWIGLEYMAQCIAAHGGLAMRARGVRPKPGLFLGSRRVRFRVQCFEPGRKLRVTAKHHAGERGLVAFDCEIVESADEAPLIQGRLNVYVLDTWHQLGGATPHVG